MRKRVNLAKDCEDGYQPSPNVIVPERDDDTSDIVASDPTRVEVISEIAKDAEKRVEEAGGFAGSSYIRVSLTWDNCNDLDLWLNEPIDGANAGLGRKIYYSRKSNGATGALLDVDANARGCKDHTPVENIVYKNLEGDANAPKPLKGIYKVTVNYYRQHAEVSDATYTLLIKLGNKTFAFENRDNLKARREKDEYYFNYQGNMGCIGEDCVPISLA